jgi:hypothetical protein
MRPLIIAIVCVTINPVSADVFEDVDVAERGFDKAIAFAKDGLAAHYKDQIGTAIKDGEFQKATGLTSRLELFEGDGLFMENDFGFGDEYAEYGKQMSAAKQQLLDAYSGAMTELAKGGQLDEVKSIQYKIRDRGLTAKWVSIRSTAYRDKYITHEDYKGMMRRVGSVGSKLNTTFEMNVGLTSDSANIDIRATSQGNFPSVVSFRSFNVPKNYLAHGNNELILMEFMDKDAFRQNASFRIRKGFYRSSATSFEAVNFPGHFLAVQGDNVVLLKHNASGEFAKASTFDIVSPRFKF